ncbi:hypothetical protein NXY29_00490 [Bacteroides fragilis]|nr:hypothetical protein [Bacteroides fragilis]
MKIIIQLSISLCAASRLILYDEAEKMIAQGHTVYFLYCDNYVDSCHTNMCGRTSDCLLCKSNLKKEIALLSKEIIFISLRKYVERKKIIFPLFDFNYKEFADFKKIEFDGINIGLGCASSYISCTRNLNPKIDDTSKPFFDFLLATSLKSLIVLENILNDYIPDQVFLFNGRLIDSKPLLELVKKRGIAYKTFEAISTNGVDCLYKSCFVNATPHSIQANTNMIYSFWESSILSVKDKMKIGKAFFENKKRALPMGDISYVKNQHLGELPSDWDQKCRNIVIFNSSEDEFAAIGDEYDRYAFFESQLMGIRFIAENFQNNSEFHFYLRIHPNLSKISYKYHTELHDFDNFDNFTVIPANSTISTYTLLDNCEKCIVFGSTVGAEATFWGKPTILLAGAMYYFLDICYIPNSKTQLINLISSQLECKSRENAIKYGYYIMNKDWINFEKIDFRTFELPFLGKKILVNNWQKVFGSRRLYTLFYFLRFKFLRFVHKNTAFRLPLNEQ